MSRIKFLVGTIAAAAAVGMSSAALANGGSYEPDYGTPASVGSDNGAGFYLGLQGGYALTHWKNIGTRGVDLSVSRSNGFAGRVFGGYAFNKYLGFEAGWTYLPSRVKIKESDNLSSSTTTKNWAADGSFVLTVPVAQQFGVYSKIGLGYLHSRDAIRLLDTDVTTLLKKGTHSSWNVTFGAGGYYDITPQIRATLGWRRFEGSPELNNKYQPNPDVFLVGLQYRFPYDVFGSGSL